MTMIAASLPYRPHGLYPVSTSMWRSRLWEGCSEFVSRFWGVGVCVSCVSLTSFCLWCHCVVLLPVCLLPDCLIMLTCISLSPPHLGYLVGLVPSICATSCLAISFFMFPGVSWIICCCGLCIWIAVCTILALCCLVLDCLLHLHWKFHHLC